MTSPILKNYRNWLDYRKRYWQAYNELASCTDRELSELRITRFDIGAIARSKARR